LKYFSLIGINIIYALLGIFTKTASMHPFLSWEYVIWFIGALLVMGIYAILWQQILKDIELSTAYMFKGTSLVFVMLLAALIFGETITYTNILGVILIIVGIALFAKA